MEDLALIVSLMLLAEYALGLTVLTFSTIYRFKNKFAKTSLVLIVLLAVETAWALSILPAFGMPPLIALVVSALMRFLPRRQKAA